MKNKAGKYDKVLEKIISLLRGGPMTTGQIVLALGKATARSRSKTDRLLNLLCLRDRRINRRRMVGTSEWSLVEIA